MMVVAAAGQAENAGCQQQVQDYSLQKFLPE
jgi:hypothetical protein